MIAILKNRRGPFYLITTFFAIVFFAIFASSLAILFSLFLIAILISYPILLDWISRLYGQEDIADEVHYAKTKDGWNIALHRHIPPIPNHTLAPVIVVHGIATNKYVIDLDKRHSLPYYLKLRGYEVFAVSLRGAGASYHESRGGYEDFTFDDLVKYDVPAILSKVLSITGSKRVNWVGHSMGAMILYSYLGVSTKKEKEKVASFVSIGGPGNLNHLGLSLIGLLSRFPRARKVLDLKFGASMLAPLAGEIYTPIDEILYNPKATRPRTVKKVMKNAIENISEGLIEQFMSWIETKKMSSLNGFHDYIELQKEITVPSLFIAGAKDAIATPETVKFVYDRAGAKYKKFLIISKEEGCTEDYGHGCLILGEKAEDDVFPKVESFLREFGTSKKLSWFGQLERKIRKRVGLRTT
ncbi:alpha/beta fold hydrolase [Leptospira semungkisensis]|uniref:Alpha/beta fold hydrolase n=1 Tax=Leptospira semungkisensis TaxID=2484985 RepID=A0A4R9G888_9LEPT|nr:alpha/beta fold hydrolase [Leptospira semungkisensis]TGK07866.1 alpha/beta fold hydrolase [Leptospira semungkisensis]